MKQRFYIFALLLSASIVFSSYSRYNENHNTPDPSVTDEGVLIGNINGTPIRWATRNLDYPGTFAPYPHSAGRFYQWGTLNGVVHHWAATGTVTGWSNSSNRAAWTTVNDPCPPGWRVPTVYEFRNLHDAGGEWTTENGVNGRRFGSGNNTIFLPAAGHRGPFGSLSGVGRVGFYWSSTAHSWYSVNTGWHRDTAWWLAICNIRCRRCRRWHRSGNGSLVSAGWRYSGRSVRCVAE